MKQVGLLILLLGISPFSHAVMFEKYADWKERPKEKFTLSEESFRIAMEKLLQQYIDKGLTKDDLYRAATAGMLETLNTGEQTWNTFLTPRELREIQSDLSGQVTGIGIEIKFDSLTGFGQILSVIPNSPSVKAGLKRDDQILSVNGQKYKGRPFQEMIGSLRGKIGETVSLKILRDDQILSRNVKRDVIPWTPVELSEIDASTQLLAIGYFTGETPSLVESKMNAINSNSTKSLLIDLRNNSGGAFDKAVRTAELFVPKGRTIVSTKDRDEKMKAFVSERGLLRSNIKVIVITNAQTSSGAELFAGALRDELGAQIVGEKTLGKWNAQIIETLPNGFAIKFTTQSFQTPKGHSYQDVGLKPDVEVALPKNVEPRELRMKFNMAQRLEQDVQLKAAAALVKAM